MSNRLQNETSPYLLQHKDNPVDWYPWCDEAFKKAKDEHKPVFLSIGYSTCHWCHVMAHESFEDRDIAAILNEHFISIKVDREERPDIDSIYMSVCQAFTGSGGWPTTIFMTPEQKPFFAGTYFPKTTQGRMAGFRELLMLIADRWKNDRDSLLNQANFITEKLAETATQAAIPEENILTRAAAFYKQSYDAENGGFGRAPKFPAAHNLIFLLEYSQARNDLQCRQMAEHTLLQMYRGGLFDHIDGGFCRYSTDERFLVPHFEKMLYDNALLISALGKAYAINKEPIFLRIAERCAAFILSAMTSPEGGFYSALDADSDGEEGKYYLLTPAELTELLGGADGKRFCRHFDITERGNFEGKNIPNLLKSDLQTEEFAPLLQLVSQYRKARCKLHLDDKILTYQNSLMISALCALYKGSEKEKYLTAAKKADDFLRHYLSSDDRLFVSYRDGKRGVQGILDDYAGYISALLSLHNATRDEQYLSRAEILCATVLTKFADVSGGFFLYGNKSEKLILRPKDTYDGAVPSGNSLMAQNLIALYRLTNNMDYRVAAERQLAFMSASCKDYPSGFSAFLSALLDWLTPPVKLTIVLSQTDKNYSLPLDLPQNAVVTVLSAPTQEYPLKNGKTTYYLCKDNTCFPPKNHFVL